MKRWLKAVFLFPFMLLMGIPDGDMGGDDGAVDTGDTNSGDTGDTGDSGDDSGDGDTGDTGDDDGDDDQSTDQGTQNPDPAPKVIPIKAYESEKEKRQRFEQENKELRQQLETAVKPAKEPQTIEEHFAVNPQGVLSYLDQQIAAAKAEFDQEKVTELVDLKANLAIKSMLNATAKTTQDAELAKLTSEIYKAVPDFDTKKPELIQVAIDNGLTEKQAHDILDPDMVGEAAVNMAKMLSRVHAIVNAGKTAKGKEVKTPMKTEPAGNGGFQNNNLSQKQLNRAKETGTLDDWAAILG